MSIKKFNLLLFISIVLLTLLTSAVIAPVDKGILYCCDSPDPAVDGKINSAEWAKGTPKDIILYSLVDQTKNITIEMMSVYGRDYLIYFGITIVTFNFNPLDLLFIVFRTIAAAPLIVNPVIDGEFTEGNDLKLMWFDNNYTTDCYTPGTGYDVWNADAEFGGINDGFGKCQFNDSQVTIEMSFPFDSGDAAGKDFALTVGSRIEFNVWYHDETDGINYCQIRTTDVDYDFNVLYIACSKAAPLPIGIIFGGLILTSVISILFKKFKK